MDQKPARHEITLKKVLYEIPGMDRVDVRRDIEFRTTESGPQDSLGRRQGSDSRRSRSERIARAQGPQAVGFGLDDTIRGGE